MLIHRIPPKIFGKLLHVDIVVVEDETGGENGGEGSTVVGDEKSG